MGFIQNILGVKKWIQADQETMQDEMQRSIKKTTKGVLIARQRRKSQDKRAVRGKHHDIEDSQGKHFNSKLSQIDLGYQLCDLRDFSVSSP